MSTKTILLISFLSTFQFTLQFSNAQTLVGDAIVATVEKDGTGDAVAISDGGDRIIVGSDLLAVNGVQEAGVARVYQLINNNWVQLGQDISGTIDGEEVGNSVCISSDGNRIAVGSSFEAVVYDFVGSNWQKVGNPLTLPMLGSGSDIDGLRFSEDGNTIGISGFSFGEDLTVYRLTGTDWERMLENFDSNVRMDFAMSADGNRIAVSRGSNEILIYDFIINKWQKVGNALKPPNQFTFAEGFDISGDGTRIVAMLEDSDFSYIGGVASYDLIDGEWNLNASIPSLDVFTNFGTTLRVSNDGNTFVFGNSYDNSVIDQTYVVVFQYIEEQWQQLGLLLQGATHDESAEDHVDITADGLRIVMGGIKSGPNDFRGFAKVFDYGPMVNVKDQFNEINAFIYPNPTTDQLHISLEELIGKTSVYLYDADGQLVSEQNFSGQSHMLSLPIDRGIYIVKLMSSTGEASTYKVFRQ